MDAGIRQSWDNIVDILSRPQVWQLRHLSLIPGRGRDFSLLQSAHTSSGSHPTSCSEDMGVAWYEADHSCPFTVVLRLCVCGAEPPLPWMPAWHTQEQLYRYQISLKTLNWIPVWRVAFTHLLLSSVSICYFWTKMSVFSSLNWWIGCCIVLRVCTNPSSFQCHTVWSCLDDVGT